MSEFKPFLESTAEAFYQQYKTKLQHCICIFPNKRSILFFRKYLTHQFRQPTFMPKMMSISDWIEEHSRLSVPPHLDLLIDLYQSFQKKGNYQHSFDHFYHFGNTILKDFDEIDKYLLEAKKIFVNIYDYKKQQDISYLTVEQITILKTFWKHFTVKPSEYKQRFVDTWKALPLVYEHYQKTLLVKKQAYRGMCYKKAIQNLEEKKKTFLDKYYVCIGLNALSPAEEMLFKQLQFQAELQFYWDCDAYYMQNDQQEAGLYLRRYQKVPPFQRSFPKKNPNHLLDEEKKIQIIGLPSRIGQIGWIMEEVKKLKNVHQSASIGIVLVDETLLLPLLYEVFEIFTKVNITMGKKFTETIMYSLLEHLFQLQNYLAKEGKNSVKMIPLAYVKAIIQHIYIQKLDTKEEMEKLCQQKEQEIPLDYLHKQNEVCKKIFQPIHNLVAFIDYLLGILDLISDNHIKLREEDKQVLKYTIEFFKSVIKSIGPIAENISLEKFIMLVKHLIASRRIPFASNSLEKIQIMGILETRNLDFEYLFLIGMNEQYFPQTSQSDSFIPYSIRKCYELPTEENSNAIYAYHFYRLLQRARRTWLTYSTTLYTENDGEMSRYLWQLRYEFPIKVEYKVEDTSIVLEKQRPIVIPKNEQVLEELKTFDMKENSTYLKNITPSALNSYLDCRLQFYLRYVLKLYRKPEVSKTVDARIFGNLFHQVVKDMYQKHILKQKNHVINKEDIAEIKKNLPKTLDRIFEDYFKSHYLNQQGLTGQQIIVKETLYKLVKQILILDESYTPFSIEGLELGSSRGLSLPIQVGDKQVILTGIIDRIDVKHDKIRIIDYKTSNYQALIQDINSLFERKELMRNQIALQVLMYAWLYHKLKNGNQKYKIEPYVISTRMMYQLNREGGFYFNKEVQKEPISCVNQYIEEFEQVLTQVLEEIFDESTSFNQTDNFNICKYCEYKSMCGR